MSVTRVVRYALKTKRGKKSEIVQTYSSLKPTLRQLLKNISNEEQKSSIKAAVSKIENGLKAKSKKPIEVGVAQLKSIIGEGGIVSEATTAATKVAKEKNIPQDKASLDNMEAKLTSDYARLEGIETKLKGMIKSGKEGKDLEALLSTRQSVINRIKEQIKS